jgi:hypothetical protein
VVSVGELEQTAPEVRTTIPEPLASVASDDVASARVITVDSIPAVDFADPDGFVPTGMKVKVLSTPVAGPPFLLAIFPADFSVPYHWHPHDTIYIVKSGELIIESEGSYRPGDVRWVNGGRPYGPETAGPDGCEFYIMSTGPLFAKDPAKEPPPSAEG